MLFSFTSRSAQPIATATSLIRNQAPAQARAFRAVLLGAMAVLGTAGAAFAQEGSTIKAKQDETATLALTVENPAQKAMQMRVVCASSNKCIVKETNRQASYGCKLNFEKLPAGRYTVLLNVGDERYEYQVQVRDAHKTTIEIPGLSAPAVGGTIASLTL